MVCIHLSEQSDEVGGGIKTVVLDPHEHEQNKGVLAHIRRDVSLRGLKVDGVLFVCIIQS